MATKLSTVFTKQELINLGFTLVNVSEKESGGGEAYSYLTYCSTFMKDLITAELKKDNTTTVEFFNALNPRPLSKEFVLAYMKESKE